MELRRKQRVQRSLSPSHTSLMRACQQEVIKDVKTIIERQPGTALQRDRTGKNALHYCAENSGVDCASRVLSAAPSLLNTPDDEGYTALHLAVISGNRCMVKYLLTKGADSRAVDSEKHSCVHWATVSGDPLCLELLIKAGADPSTPDIHGAYPVHYAAQMCGPNSEMGNDVQAGLAVLRKLLEYGVDVSVVDRDGRPPLLWAASGGSSDAILALVKAGANVNATDRDGLTALHCASSRGHVDCLETLVTFCGADVDKADDNGCTALFYAVTLGHADCTNFLLNFGANPNRQDNKGRTAAHCGAAKGQLETLKILAQHRANLWLRNVKGDMPLHEAVQSGRKDLVEWFLQRHQGAVNVTNANGRTPLHIAAITNNVDMCKVLMDYGAYINPVMRNTKGQHMTPLDAALHRGNRNCAKYLNLHGAYPASKLQDRNNRRAPQTHLSDPLELSPNTRRRLVRDSSAQTEPQRRDADTQARVDQRNAAASTETAKVRSTAKVRCPAEDGSGKPIIAKVYVHTKRSKTRRLTKKPTVYRRDVQTDKLHTYQPQRQRGRLRSTESGASTMTADSDTSHTSRQTDNERDIPSRKASQPKLYEDPAKILHEEEELKSIAKKKSITDHKSDTVTIRKESLLRSSLGEISLDEVLKTDPDEKYNDDTVSEVEVLGETLSTDQEASYDLDGGSYLISAEPFDASEESVSVTEQTEVVIDYKDPLEEGQEDAFTDANQAELNADNNETRNYVEGKMSTSDQEEGLEQEENIHQSEYQESAINLADLSEDEQRAILKASQKRVSIVHKKEIFGQLTSDHEDESQEHSSLKTRYKTETHRRYSLRTPHEIHAKKHAPGTPYEIGSRKHLSRAPSDTEIHKYLHFGVPFKNLQPLTKLQGSSEEKIVNASEDDDINVSQSGEFTVAEDVLNEERDETLEENEVNISEMEENEQSNAHEEQKIDDQKDPIFCEEYAQNLDEDDKQETAEEQHEEEDLRYDTVQDETLDDERMSNVEQENTEEEDTYDVSQQENLNTVEEEEPFTYEGESTILEQEEGSIAEEEQETKEDTLDEEEKLLIDNEDILNVDNENMGNEDEEEIADLDRGSSRLSQEQTDKVEDDQEDTLVVDEEEEVGDAQRDTIENYTEEVFGIDQESTSGDQREESLDVDEQEANAEDTSGMEQYDLISDDKERETTHKYPCYCYTTQKHGTDSCYCRCHSVGINRPRQHSLHKEIHSSARSQHELERRRRASVHITCQTETQRPSSVVSQPDTGRPSSVLTPHETESRRRSSLVSPHEIETRRRSSVVTPHETETRRRSSVVTPYETETRRRSSVVTPHETETRRRSSVAVPHATEFRRRSSQVTSPETDIRRRSSVITPHETETRRASSVVEMEGGRSSSVMSHDDNEIERRTSEVTPHETGGRRRSSLITPRETEMWRRSSQASPHDTETRRSSSVIASDDAEAWRRSSQVSSPETETRKRSSAVIKRETGTRRRSSVLVSQDETRRCSSQVTPAPKPRRRSSVIATPETDYQGHSPEATLHESETRRRSSAVPHETEIRRRSSTVAAHQAHIRRRSSVAIPYETDDSGRSYIVTPHETKIRRRSSVISSHQTEIRRHSHLRTAHETEMGKRNSITSGEETMRAYSVRALHNKEAKKSYSLAATQKNATQESHSLRAQLDKRVCRRSVSSIHLPIKRIASSQNIQNLNKSEVLDDDQEDALDGELTPDIHQVEVLDTEIASSPDRDDALNIDENKITGDQEEVHQEEIHNNNQEENEITSPFDQEDLPIIDEKEFPTAEEELIANALTPPNAETEKEQNENTIDPDEKEMQSDDEDLPLDPDMTQDQQEYLDNTLMSGFDQEDGLNTVESENPNDNQEENIDQCEISHIHRNSESDNEITANLDEENVERKTEDQEETLADQDDTSNINDAEPTSEQEELLIAEHDTDKRETPDAEESLDTDNETFILSNEQDEDFHDKTSTTLVQDEEQPSDKEGTDEKGTRKLSINDYRKHNYSEDICTCNCHRKNVPKQRQIFAPSGRHQAQRRSSLKTSDITEIRRRHSVKFERKTPTQRRSSCIAPYEINAQRDALRSLQDTGIQKLSSLRASIDVENESSSSTIQRLSEDESLNTKDDEEQPTADHERESNDNQAETVASDQEGLPDLKEDESPDPDPDPEQEKHSEHEGEPSVEQEEAVEAEEEEILNIEQQSEFDAESAATSNKRTGVNKRVIFSLDQKRKLVGAIRKMAPTVDLEYVLNNDVEAETDIDQDGRLSSEQETFDVDQEEKFSVDQEILLTNEKDDEEDVIRVDQDTLNDDQETSNEDLEGTMYFDQENASNEDLEDTMVSGQEERTDDERKELFSTDLDDALDTDLDDALSTDHREASDSIEEGDDISNIQAYQIPRSLRYKQRFHDGALDTNTAVRYKYPRHIARQYIIETCDCKCHNVTPRKHRLPSPHPLLRTQHRLLIQRRVSIMPYEIGTGRRSSLATVHETEPHRDDSRNSYQSRTHTRAQNETEKQSPQSSARSFVTVKDSGYSDVVGREETASSDDERSDSDARPDRTRSRNSRNIASSSVAENYRTEEEGDNQVPTPKPRSSSLQMKPVKGHRRKQ